MEMLSVIEFKWEEDGEKSMIRVCPEIYKKYRKNPLK